MTPDTIDRLVRQANPVPDPRVLEPVETSVLVLDKQRRTQMQTHDRIEVEQERKPIRWGPLLGIAAAAAVVIGAVLVLRPGRDAPVAEGPGTPVEVAAAFVEAYGSVDADRVATHLTPDAVNGYWGGMERLRVELRFWEAVGFRQLLDVCEETSTTLSGTIVRCNFSYHAIRSDELGLGPYTGSWWNLTVQDGKIVAVSDHFEYDGNGFSSEMWEPFAAWVAATYPEDVTVMYTDGSQTMQEYTDESIALWEERSREFAEVVRGTSG